MLIKCGDPASSATYTRFVLPFAYCLTLHNFAFSNAESNDNVYYEKTEPEDLIWRKKYLTYETADVLFKRAEWFTLKDSQYPLEIDMNFRDCGKDDYITVHIKQPSLVLFEWPKPEHKKKCLKPCKDPSLTQCLEDEHNILRTGFLVIELYFPEHNHKCLCLDNLLELNELFRYWQQPFEGHEDKVDNNMGYKKLLGNLPFIHGSAKTISDKQDPLDLYFERWASLLDVPIRDEQGNHWRLFPQQWMQNARKFVSGEDKVSPGWAVYSDNRTFVWTCAIMENGGSALKKHFCMPKQKAWNFGHWTKLLNVDLPGGNVDYTHQTTDFEKEWAEERTYKRWEEGGTFYGFNYHGGAMLGPISEPEDSPLWKHFGQMYFDQILLLLYIRVALFRFSMRLNRISETALERESSDYAEWLEESQKFRESFALFTNLYQFPFLSNQQQAIEMYSLARKHMDIDDLFKEIQQEVNSNHEYLSIKQATWQTDTTTRLTVVATIGITLALATSFLGMEIIVDGFSGSFSWDGVRDWGILIVTVIVFSIITIAIIWKSGSIAECFGRLSKKKCFSRKSRKP